MGMDYISYLPSTDSMLTIVVVTIIIFLGICGMGIIIFAIIIAKKSVPINLYIQRAGESAYKYMQVKGKRFVEKGIHKLKISKIGVIDKIVPNIENRYLYPTNKGNDAANIVLDNKGFLHKLRIATPNEMIDFFVLKKMFTQIATENDDDKLFLDAQYDLTKTQFLKDNPDYEMFNVANPHETIEMITRQIQAGDKKYVLTWIERWGGVVVPVAGIMGAVMIMMMAFVFSSRLFGA